MTDFATIRPPTSTEPPNTEPPSATAPLRPGWSSLIVGMALSLLIIHLSNLHDDHIGPLSWYTTVIWSLPLVLSVQGVAGARITRRRAHSPADPPYPSHDDGTHPVPSLVVVMPTIGRHDTLPGLERAAHSLATELAGHVERLRIDLVVEEDCETMADILRLCRSVPAARVLVVPRDYRTPNGTRFKARANHYALQQRLADGEDSEHHWVLHMDDDTSLSPDAAAHIAAVIRHQASGRGPKLHLAQGILAYPRPYSARRLTWYADAVRPGCDMSFFAVTTGRGRPRSGLHGELLLIRASVEAEIGWDFGPDSLVEDAQFALHFCDRHPGASTWFPAWCEGASPASFTDFVRQRERWVWGLLRLLGEPAVPVRHRLRLLPSVAIWMLTPFSNPFLLLLVGLAIGNPAMAPTSPLAAAAWSFNYGFYVWLYWEGFAVNRRSCPGNPGSAWEGVVVVLLMPVFCSMECVGIVCGVMKYLRRRPVHFTVIRKPA